MIRKLKLLVALLILLFCAPAPAQQQQQQSIEALTKQVQALTQMMQAMQRDLQQIKARVQSQRAPAPPPPPQNVVLDLAGRPSQGEKTAVLTLVEFSDYQCSFCAKHIRETAPQIDKEYIQTGKLRHVFMDLPLESIHKNAFKAAEAAHCAGEQGKFWEMHDELFANQKTLDQWNAHAEAIGIDVAKFEQCMNNGKVDAQIRADMDQARKAHMTGTPGFFLAYTDPKGTTAKTVTRLVGARPYASFKEAIDKLLHDAPKGDGKGK